MGTNWAGRAQAFERTLEWQKAEEAWLAAESHGDPEASEGLARTRRIRTMLEEKRNKIEIALRLGFVENAADHLSEYSELLPEDDSTVDELLARADAVLRALSSEKSHEWERAVEAWQAARDHGHCPAADKLARATEIRDSVEGLQGAAIELIDAGELEGATEPLRALANFLGTEDAIVRDLQRRWHDRRAREKWTNHLAGIVCFVVSTVVGVSLAFALGDPFKNEANFWVGGILGAVFVGILGVRLRLFWQRQIPLPDSISPRKD